MIKFSAAACLAIAATFLYRNQGAVHVPVGIAFVAVAFLFAFLTLRSSLTQKPYRVILALASAGASLYLAYAGSQWLYESYLAELHESRFLTVVVGGTLRFFSGPHVVFDGDFLRWRGGTHTRNLAVGIERLDLHPVICYLSAVGVLSFASKSLSLKSWMTEAVLCCLLCLVRAVLLMTFDLHMHHEGSLSSATLFASPLIRSFTVIPILVVASAAGGRFSPAAPSKELARRTSHRLAMATIVLVGVAVCWALPWTARTQSGTVLFDDYHSEQWEPAGGEFGKGQFGAQWLYGYTSLVNLLRKEHEVRVTDKPLAEETLEGVNVVVIKTPTRGFSPDEIEVVMKFVQRGGGVLLIGDHTNLLGMTSNINELSSKWGSLFRTDGSNRLSTGYFSEMPKNAGTYNEFTSGTGKWTMLTSCTIRNTMPADICVHASDVNSDELDYSARNFFGNLTTESHEHFGQFPVIVGRQIGRGRVVFLADGTFLSNFWIFNGDQSQIFKNIIAYLSRAGSQTGSIRRWVGYAITAGVGLTIILFCVFLLAYDSALVAWMPVLVVGVTQVALVASRTSLDRTATIARNPEETVCFVRHHCVLQLPPPIGADTSQFVYTANTLYCIPQRLRLASKVVGTVSDIDAPAAAVFFCFPFLNQQDAVANAIIKATSTTKRVIVLAQTEEQAETLAKLVTERLGTGEFLKESFSSLETLQLAVENQSTIMIIKNGVKLTDKTIGHPFEEPSADQRALYNAAYKLIESE